jgi:hypothetical protein
MKLTDIVALNEKAKHHKHHAEGTHVTHQVSGHTGVVNGKPFIGNGIGWLPVLSGRGQSAWPESEASESASAEAAEVAGGDSDDGGGAPPAGGGVSESVNHMGDTEYKSYAAWKAACKKMDPEHTIEGDKDVAQAHGKNGKGIGDWDGEMGLIYKKK